MKFRYLIAAMAALTLTFGCDDSLTAPEGNGQEQTGEEGTGGEDQPGEDDNPGGEEEIPVTYSYNVVESAPEDWSGDYLITSNDGGEIIVFDSWDSGNAGASTTSFGAETLSEGIPAETGDPLKAIFTRIGNGYSIHVSNVGYIGLESDKNSLNCSDAEPDAGTSEYLWTISLSSGQGVCTISSMQYPDRALKWNSSASMFRCYSSGQQEITLFRKTASDGSDIPGGGEDQPGGDENPDGDEDPDPDPVPGNSGKYGWFELPSIPDEDGNRIDDNDPSLYYAYHFCAGGEMDDKGRTARNYTVCYSAEHHCPAWVAAPRHSMYVGSANRTDAYNKDPDIPSEIQYNSKSTGDGCNKGHMLGSAERTSSSGTNRQVFYYTNIAPQLSKTFNTGGGAWNNLENHVDELVCRDTLYEVVGCYFEKFTDAYGKSTEPVTISFGGRSDVSRPTMFYYALLRTKSGNSGKSVTECSADELQCVAFCIRHTMEKGHKPQANDMMSISDLEKLTGFRYFTNVPQAPKDTFNPSDWL